MRKADELKYFDKEWKKMFTRLKGYLKTSEQEDLHQFRVQVKKLRAFIILADSINSDQKLTQYFKPVKKVFKKAGEVRSPYINLELGKACHIDSDVFIAQQQQLMHKADEQFKGDGNKNIRKLKRSHTVIKSKIQAINNIHINLFYSQLLQQIDDFFANINFDDKLHNARKQIKILIYNYKMVHTALNIGFNNDYLEQIQTTIGDWHDNVLANQLISDNELNNKSALANLKRHFNKLKKTIMAITPDFYTQATTTVKLPLEQLS